MKLVGKKLKYEDTQLTFLKKMHHFPHPQMLPRHPPRRWVVEVGHSWFNRFRRLLIRWEKQPQRYARIYSASGLPNFIS